MTPPRHRHGHRHRAGRSGARAGVALAVAATALAMAGAPVVARLGGDDAGPTAQPPPAATPQAPEPATEAPRATPPPGPRATPRPAPRPRSRTTHTRVAAAPMAPSPPSRLLVPSIGVEVDVMDLGLTDDGVLEVPPGALPAGWYVGSPTPGELGPAIIAGHVRWGGAPGVFERLHELTVGDVFSVVRDDGSVAEFRVTTSERYRKDAFPTDRVYGDIGFPGIRLITCAGLDPATGEYDDNVVVFARLTTTSG